MDQNFRKMYSADDIQLVPQFGELRSRKDAELNPFIFCSPMDTVAGFDLAQALLEAGEYATVARRAPRDEYIRALKELGTNPRCFFSVGVGESAMKEFVDLLLEAEVDYPVSVCVDTAHGHSVYCRDTIVYLRSKDFVGHIMSGSVCTPEGAYDSYVWGADFIRVGIGNGSACSTRLMTGVGVPQFSAVLMVRDYLFKHENVENMPVIIADGGIRTPGDVAKYLCAGADAVMMGNVLSKAREAAGWIPNVDGVLVKRYRGQASASYQKDFLGQKPDCAEGVTFPEMKWTGTTALDIVKKYRGGVSSTISYLGLTSMSEMVPENVFFVEVTRSGVVEASPHGLKR